jgi:hypothetical protein
VSNRGRGLAGLLSSTAKTPSASLTTHHSSSPPLTTQTHRLSTAYSTQRDYNGQLGSSQGYARFARQGCRRHGSQVRVSILPLQIRWDRFTRTDTDILDKTTAPESASQLLNSSRPRAPRSTPPPGRKPRPSRLRLSSYESTQPSRPTTCPIS